MFPAGVHQYCRDCINAFLNAINTPLPADEYDILRLDAMRRCCHTTGGQLVLCDRGRAHADALTGQWTRNVCAPVAFVDAALRNERALQTLPFELIDIIAQYTEACVH